MTPFFFDVVSDADDVTAKLSKGHFIFTFKISEHIIRHISGTNQVLIITSWGYMKEIDSNSCHVVQNIGHETSLTGLKEYHVLYWFNVTKFGLKASQQTFPQS